MSCNRRQSYSIQYTQCATKSRSTVKPVMFLYHLFRKFLIIIIMSEFVKRKWSSDALHRRASIESFQLLRKCLS